MNTAPSETEPGIGPGEGHLISVVIPIYNGEKYVRECLDTVYRQSYRRIEVVCVDDGSTDRSAEILDSYADRVRIVRGEHRNLPSARNRGIAAATGEFTAFLDVDDLWEPDKLEKQVAVFARRPEVGLVFTDVVKLRSSGVRRGSPERSRLARKLAHTDPFFLLARRNFITPSSVMIRRAVFASAGVFDESLHSCEDWEYWLRLAAHGIRMAFVDEALVFYRAHEDNMSRVVQRMHEGRLAVVQRVFETGGLPLRYQRAERECLARVQYESANAFYSAGDTGRFEACFREGWRLRKRAASGKALRRFGRHLLSGGKART